MLSFFRFFKHITLSAWKNATPMQAALITTILLMVIVILIVSVVQVIVPFIYSDLAILDKILKISIVRSENLFLKCICN